MITFSTCWYELKSKFNKKIYESWFSNFLLNVYNFNLVIYTDEKSKYLINDYIQNNNRIKVIILDMNEFYNYKYKENLIKNH